MKLSSSETSTKFHYNKSFSLILLTNETSGSKSDDSKIHRNIRNVVANRKYIWDYGVIPYEVDKEFAPKLRQMFIKAMQHWEQDTCLKFVEYDSKEHTNYIYFTKTDNGCSSEIGKRGISRQSILISPDCENFGNILHELGHALGFFHEHARPDRDDYIVVHYDNIERGKEINFHKQLENDSDSSGLPYDFESITHYSKRAFSKNHHQETLKPIVKVEVDIGQRLRLSQGDIKKANLLYKCLECGQTLYLPKGDILSPHYQGLKIAALEGKVHSYNLIYEVCEWHIRAGNGERIALQINDVSLHYSLNCSEDYIEIRDGYWHRSPLLKRLCGNHTIIKLESQSKHMLIKYVNRNAAKGYYGFKANYQFLFDSIIKLNDSWHLDFISHSAHLTDKPYTWYIVAPEGYQVALKFEFFDLGNNECDLDYLEIRNGNNSASRILAKICSEPDNVVSTTNEMFLKFVSESSIDDLGFSAIFMVEVDECKLGTHNCQQKCRNTLGSYRCTCLPDYTLLTDGRSCVKNPCSSVINATVDDGKGTFGLTSFPNDINLPGKCIWKLIAPDKHTLFLRFTQFELVCDESDYLVIYSQLKNKLLKKIGEFYCHEFPPFVKSMENILRLELNLGEEAYQRTKLKAEYKIVATPNTVYLLLLFPDNDECIIENGGCEHICQNTFGSFECLCRDGFSLQGNGRNCTETECKFNVTNPYGKISSFNYPTNYTSNTYCYWRFQTVLGHRIRLKFLEFDLEYHQECIYDNVTIYDGRSRASSSLGIYCGKLDANHEVLATTNNMLMIFRTDANVQATGFIARHLTECGSYLKSKNHPQILFSHPSYGTRSYRYNMFCDWQITTDSDKSIEIKFLDFELEYDESCKSDYLEIKEESIGFHKNYGRFCGNNKPPNIKSCSDMISLRFITNELFNLNGFKIEFKTIEAQECTEETIDEINY
uniref:Metalloendopeptidase n=1 Tax=Glossina brevipalpis TaxID=37001 RepID=A0A1A9WNS1_9MUSC